MLRPVFHCATDVDEVISDHPKPDPALYSSVALVAAAIQPVSSLDHADAALTTRSAISGRCGTNALLLLALTFRALGRAIGNADAFDTLRFRCCLVFGGVERGIRSHHAWRAPQFSLMRFNSGNQQIRIVGSPSVDLIIDHNLVFGFLQFDHLAELVGLCCFAFADDLR
jgi:hypothetical protein